MLVSWIRSKKEVNHKIKIISIFSKLRKELLANWRRSERLEEDEKTISKEETILLQVRQKVQLFKNFGKNDTCFEKTSLKKGTSFFLPRSVNGLMDSDSMHFLVMFNSSGYSRISWQWVCSRTWRLAQTRKIRNFNKTDSVINLKLLTLLQTFPWLAPLESKGNGR